MGMYTHLRLDLEIYPKYKDEVLAYIESVPRLRSTSYYFYDRGQHFIEEDDHVKCVVENGSRETAPMCTLHADVSLKNYGNEIGQYLEFLGDKVALSGSFDGEIVGLVRYEEDFMPDLLLFKAGKIEQKKVEFSA
jgi:hypothetical protein